MNGVVMFVRATNLSLDLASKQDQIFRIRRGGVVRNMLINIIYYPTNPRLFIDT